MVVAAALLVMAFLGLGILGADSTAVILMLIGAFAIVMETWFGEGELAVAGAIMTILGILLLYRGEYFIWTFNMRLLVIGGIILLVAGVGFFGFYLHKIRETLAMRESPLEKTRLVGMRGGLYMWLGMTGLLGPMYISLRIVRLWLRGWRG